LEHAGSRFILISRLHTSAITSHGLIGGAGSRRKLRVRFWMWVLADWGCIAYWQTCKMGTLYPKHILHKFGFHLVSQEEIKASGRIICLYELLRKDWEASRT